MRYGCKTAFQQQYPGNIFLNLNALTLKNKLYQFFIWCAGSDPDCLNESPRSEHIKHAGYGALVLVPAILALFSMTYAISTLTDNPIVYCLGGLAWAFIVFAFDRFIVSTFRKSETIWKDISSPTFISRIIFASLVGFVVAHPIVLLNFSETIEQELAREKEAEVQSIWAAYEAEIDEVRVRNDSLNKTLFQKIELRDCKKKLLTAEQAGVAVELDCGYSSGLATYGKRAEEIGAQIESLNAEIQLLTMANGEVARLNNERIAVLDTTRDQKIAAYVATHSDDYLARERALSNLMRHPETGGTVFITTVFIILFFWFVDILAVLWKAFTKRGPYDDLLEVQERGIALEAKTTLNDMILEHETQVELDGLRWKEQLSGTGVYKQGLDEGLQRVYHLFDSEKAFRDKVRAEQDEFEAYLAEQSARIKRIKDAERRAKQQALLEKLKQSFYNSSSSAFEIKGDPS